LAHKPSRMEVNAAIEKLIGFSEDADNAAQTVILYGDDLKTSAALQIEGVSAGMSRGRGVSGYSPGHGNVTIEDKDKEETREFIFGVHKDRVGHYRLWKEAPGLLCFHYFWKSGLAVRGFSDTGPDVYRLGYDQQSLLPEFLGVERSRCILKLGILEFRLRYLERVHGKIRNPRIGTSIIIG